MSSKVVQGVLALYIDGRRKVVGKGEFTVRGGKVKTSQILGSGFKSQEPTDYNSIKGTCVRDPDFDVEEFYSVTDATVELVEGSTGNSYSMSNCHNDNDEEIKINGGQADCNFVSGPGALKFRKGGG